MIIVCLRYGLGLFSSRGHLVSPSWIIIASVVDHQLSSSFGFRGFTSLSDYFAVHHHRLESTTTRARNIIAANHRHLVPSLSPTPRVILDYHRAETTCVDRKLSPPRRNLFGSTSTTGYIDCHVASAFYFDDSNRAVGTVAFVNCLIFR